MPQSSTISLNPWLSACQRGDIDTLEQLAGGGAWPDLVDSFFPTSALILAASGKHTEVVNRLLQHDPLINQQDANGKTALSHAVENKDKQMVKALLDAGADPLIPNNHGYTPLMEAATQGPLDILDLLWTAHPHPTHLDMQSNGGSAIMVAIEERNPQALKWLLERGANVDLLDPVCNLTPLWDCAFSDNASCALLLIEAGADINWKDVSGESYLHVAAENKSKEVLIVLLRNGADPLTLNKHGQTVVDVARAQAWNEYDEMIAHLEARALQINTPSSRIHSTRRI